MNRQVQPELLDQLPPSDRGAIASRRDLPRVNAWMGHARLMDRAFSGVFPCPAPRTIVDLGGGDGTFLLQLARRMVPRGKGARATIVDRRNLLTGRTRDAFAALSWQVDSVESDIFAWLQRPHPQRSAPQRSDLTVTTLFLHHFQPDNLQELLRGAAGQTELFLACEPRRTAYALRAAGLLWVIGCNRVTLHDAQISVRAGFLGSELSSLWPAGAGWQLTERPAGQFTHCFMARRPSPQHAPQHSPQHKNGENGNSGNGNGRHDL
jgi:hypothetical protein